MTWYGKIIALVLFCIITIVLNPQPFLFQNNMLKLIVSISALWASYRAVKLWKDEE